MACEDFSFAHAIPAKHRWEKHGQIAAAGIAGECALQGSNLLVQGLDAKQSNARGVNGRNGS